MNLFKLILCIFTAVWAYSCGHSPKKDGAAEEQGPTVEISEKNTADSASKDKLALSEKKAERNSEKPGSFSVTPNGLKYKFFVHHSRFPAVKAYDVMHLDMRYYLDDSLLFDSRDVPGSFKMQLKPPEYPGAISEGFIMMHLFDSACFVVDAEDFYTQTRQQVFVPEYINEGDSLQFFVKLKNITPAKKYSEKLEAREKEIKAQEKSLINKYILTSDFSYKKLDDGMYRTLLKKGNGPKIQAGAKVRIHYKLEVLYGNFISDTRLENAAFEFTQGADEVIPGLERGLKGIPAGSMLSLIIPFDQAYGREKQTKIPPYSTLLFEIDVLSVH